jgi:hypothetical protein
VGGALCRRLHDAGEPVVAIDAMPSSSPWRTPERDVLVDDVVLPDGRVVLALGSSNPRPLRPAGLDPDVPKSSPMPQRGVSSGCLAGRSFGSTIGVPKVGLEYAHGYWDSPASSAV